MKRKELNKELINNSVMAYASNVSNDWEVVLRKVKQNAMCELRKAFNELVKDFEDNTFIPFGDVEELSLDVIDYESGEAEAVEVDGVYVRKNGDMIDIEVDTWNGCSKIEYYCTDDIINILVSSIEYIRMNTDYIATLDDGEECEELTNSDKRNITSIVKRIFGYNLQSLEFKGDKMIIGVEGKTYGDSYSSYVSAKYKDGMWFESSYCGDRDKSSIGILEKKLGVDILKKLSCIELDEYYD